MANTESVRIGNKTIGGGQPCYIIAEIGINHNGDIDLAKRLISVAVAAGCDAVKFQKRTVDVVYTAEELAKPRENPFGTTNGDLKHGLEFELRRLSPRSTAFCQPVKIAWFASCWDEGSVDFIEQFDVPCYKIASASLTDDNLLRHTRAKGKPIILSTGMSTYRRDRPRRRGAGQGRSGPAARLQHLSGHYEELNLRAIPDDAASATACPWATPATRPASRRPWPRCVLGACCVERHITLDRAMWGSRPGRVARAQRHHAAWCATSAWSSSRWATA